MKSANNEFANKKNNKEKISSESVKEFKDYLNQSKVFHIS